MLAKLQGMAGEKSRRVTVAGKPFTRNTTTYFKQERYYGLIPPLWGVLCPVHSCGPVVGLRVSAWETGTPFLCAFGIPQRLSRVSLEQIQ